MSEETTTRSTPDPAESWPMMVDEWPNTPTMERLTDAVVGWQIARQNVKGAAGREPEIVMITDANGSEQPFDVTHSDILEMAPINQYSTDTISLNDCLQAMKLYQAATDLFQMIDFHAYRGGPEHASKLPSFTPEQWYSVAVAQFLHTMAQHGESTNTIGISWQKWREDLKDKSEYVMTKLSRDEDWMGFNITLENIQDVKFVCYQAEHRQLVPGFAVGYPAQDNDLSRHNDNPFPKGQATQLRDLLLWHGAAECVWAGANKYTKTEVRSN